MGKNSVLIIDEEIKQQFDFISQSLDAHPDLLIDFSIAFADQSGIDRSSPNYQLTMCKFAAAYHIYQETGQRKIRQKRIDQRAKQLDRQIRLAKKAEKALSIAC